jgi:hypothetical protein
VHVLVVDQASAAALCNKVLLPVPHGQLIFITNSMGGLERLIRSIDGFVSFSLVRTAGGGFTVSVFRDKAGTDESVRVARDWISKNAGQIGAAPPTVAEGTVVLQVQ